MNEDLLRRIERETGIADVVAVLAERVAPSDLHSLLLAVYARAAGAVSPKRLLEQYASNRFVAPSPADPRRLAEVDRIAWAGLPEGYAPIELAPLCPLGTCSVVGTVSQNEIVSTARNVEVVADSSNVLALECAVRRREQAKGGRNEPVLLAASHRLTRAQVFPGARSWAHFRVLSLCAAGRDEGDFRFEARHLAQQIAFYVQLLQALEGVGLAFRDPRVAVTDFSGGRLGERVLDTLATGCPKARLQLDPDRKSGHNYYTTVCFKLFAVDREGVELELGDGGDTPWTQTLLSNAKERLVISGLGVERICAG